MKRLAFAIAALGLALVGCGPSEVSSQDSEKVKQDYSKENYEKTMKKLGKGEELEREQKAAAERNGR